jgi:BTB/POZ domain-containing protein 13
MSLNEQRQVKHTQTTGLKSLSFFKNEEVTLLLLDKDLTYPLLLSVNLLFSSLVTLSRESDSMGGLPLPSPAQIFVQEDYPCEEFN